MVACKWCSQEFEISDRRFSAHVANCKHHPGWEERKQKIRQALHKPRIEIELECLKCQSQFKLSVTPAQLRTGRYRKHCDQKCSNSKGPRSEETKLKIARALRKEGYTCKDCGLHFEIHQAYASHRRVHVRKFEDLKKDGTRKVWLVRENGHRCWVCGNSEWMNRPIPLELDHIDGDPGNNDRSNLRILCPNCHAQTPTYKSRNAGRIDVDRSSRQRQYEGLRKSGLYRSVVNRVQGPTVDQD